MAQAPNQRTDPPAEATTAEPAAAGTQSRLRAILGDNPLAIAATALASGVIALLLFILNGIDNRIDRLEDTVAAGFAAQDAKMDRRFAEQDAKIDEINLKLTALIAELDAKFDAKFDELNLKLTALIAGLNKTDEVDAALEGRLLDSEKG